VEFLLKLQNMPISKIKNKSKYPDGLLPLTVALNKMLEYHTGKRNRSFDFLLNNN
jgi:hypothetical protein